MRLIGLALLRLRDQRTATIAFAILVAVTVFGAGATPRLLDRTSDQALRAEVTNAGPGSADVELIEEGRLVLPADEPLAEVVRRGDRNLDLFPSGVESLMTTRYSAIDTAFWSVLSPTPEASTIFLRIQEDIGSHISYVEGRAPSGALEQAEFAEAGTDDPIAILEAALSVPAAQALEVEVGDTLVLGRDSTDPLANSVTAPIAVSVVGTFETIDQTDAYWSGDTEVGQPWIRSASDDVEFRAAIAVLADDAYPALLDATATGNPPLRYRWRHLVEVDRLDADAAGQLIADLRRMEGLFPATATSSPIVGTLLRSDLRRLVESQQARWNSVETILLIVAIGVAAVATLAIGLVAVLAVRRRRRGLATWVARGASQAQIAVATMAETAVVALPATMVAIGVAIALIAAEDRDGTMLGAALGLACVGLVIGAVLRGAAEDPRAPDRRIVRGASGRRIMVEAVIVVGALFGAVLLRQRGIGSVADPLIAAVPALVGLAAGLLAVRLFPLPMRLASSLASLRPGLVPSLGLRRATRETTTASVLLVLMMTAMIGSFALATQAHVMAVGEAVAWHSVGAPFRLTSSSGAVTDRLTASALPGVEAAARAYQTSVAAAGTRGFEVLALDAPSYRSIMAGTQLGDLVPPELLESVPATLPAIVSSALVADVNGVRIGDEFGINVRGDTVELRAVAVRDSFPTLTPNGRFVVISLTQLEARDPGSPLPTTSLFIGAADDAAGALRTALAEVNPSLVLASRAEANERFRSSPAISALIATLTAGVAVTAIYAALAVSASLAVAGAARGAETAHLRALGLDAGQGVRLMLAEHASTVLIGFGAGSALGILMFALLRPGLGMASLVGSTLDVPLRIGPGLIGIMFGATAVIATLGIGVSLALERATAPAGAGRGGIE